MGEKEFDEMLNRVRAALSMLREEARLTMKAWDVAGYDREDYLLGLTDPLFFWFESMRQNTEEDEDEGVVVGASILDEEE